MKNVTSSKISAAIFSALLLAPTLAHAHSGPAGHTHGFEEGFAHPLLGLDHVLAMLAVGLWAAQLGGRARWAVPAAFVSVMTLASALGMAGVQVPFVDAGIIASVVMLGLLLCTAARLPLAASMALVGFFAAFHGLAHGAEIPANVGGFEFATGFVLATAALHAAGFGLATLLQRTAQAAWLRLAGAAIVFSGALLVVS